MEENKYPHWKDALLGNDGAVANLRCAVKYGFWHAGYALLGVLGIVLLALAWTFDKVTGTGAVDRVQSFLAHPYVDDATDLILAWAVGVYFGAIASWLIIKIIREPFLLVELIAVCVGVIVGALAIVAVAAYLWKKTRDTRQTTVALAGGAARRAGERAVETPGVRRVYGQCPVSMDIEPKWFERMTQAFE
ncbi:hypothetical protein HCTV5_6 [Halovirus HCTV-5]|uniref:hypothetical protein n=1 Tax=Halovirus HCTV-5 TaxID=1273748 RepID=UPI0003348BF9|nr:hypothetical protein M200_gp006 [Halovirus HCTV-5]AGM11617.1 hypothetical protein HCTV5_6 [Halovirus HCTV-5]